MSWSYIYTRSTREETLLPYFSMVWSFKLSTKQMETFYRQLWMFFNLCFASYWQQAQSVSFSSLYLIKKFVSNHNFSIRKCKYHDFVSGIYLDLKMVFFLFDQQCFHIFHVYEIVHLKTSVGLKQIGHIKSWTLEKKMSWIWNLRRNSTWKR